MLAVLTCGWASMPQAAVAQEEPEVSAPITLTDDAGGEVGLTLGLDPGASEGNDGTFGEERAPPFPPDPSNLVARFIDDHLNGGNGLEGFPNTGMPVDIRQGSASFTGMKVYEINFATGDDASEVTIEWNLPEGATGTIEDRFGGNVYAAEMEGSGSLTVGPDAPEAIITIEYEATQAPAIDTNAGLGVDEGGSAAITTSELSASDPDNTASDLTYSVTTGPTQGELLVGGIRASSFTQADIESGDVKYNHTSTEGTDDSFTFDLTDPSGAGPTGKTFQVSVNALPTASDDSDETTEDQSVTTDVLTNDTDPERSLDASSVQVESGPSDGSATANDDGFITYAPDDGFTGTDSYTYTVADNEGARSGEATVTIDVEEDSQEGVSISVPDTTAVAGNTVSVPIRLENLDDVSEITSYDFGASFKGEVLSYVGFEAEETLSGKAGFSISESVIQGVDSTKARVAAFGTSSLNSVAAQGVMIRLAFRADSTGSTEVKLKDFKFNGGTPQPDPSIPRFTVTVDKDDGLAAPEDLRAASKDQQVDLTWSPGGDSSPAGYNVYRSISSFSDISEATKLNSSLVSDTSYTDTEVTNGTKYFYRVTAVDSANSESALSDEVSATPTSGGDSPPIAPEASSPQRPGSEFWVDVRVGSESNAVENLDQVGFDLGFEPQHLSHVDDEAGSFLGDVQYASNVESDNGIVSVGATRADDQGKSGSGVVARVKVAVGEDVAGGTELTFSIQNVEAEDPSDAPIDLDPQDLDVTVRSGIAVWPGDMDNSGEVDQFDVFPLGDFWGTTGPSRAEEDQGCEWRKTTTQPWTPEEATYADANGDGEVNQFDIFCLGDNWGTTQGSGAASSGAAATTSAAGPTAGEGNSSHPRTGRLVLEVSEAEGEAAWVTIQAREVENLLGFGAELTYPAEDWEVQQVEPMAWLGEDLLAQTRTEAEAGRVGIGLSRKGTGRGGSGPLARVKMRPSAPVEKTGRAALLEAVRLVESAGRTAGGSPIDFQTKKSASLESPGQLSLEGGYPNPARSSATIEYTLPEAQHVRLAVFDVLGRRVATLVDQRQTAGRKTAALDVSAEGLSSGTYMLRLTAAGETKTSRITVTR